MAVATGVARRQASKKRTITGRKKLNAKKAFRRVVAGVSIIASLVVFAKVNTLAQNIYDKYNVPPAYTQQKNIIDDSLENVKSLTPYVIWQGKQTSEEILNAKNKMDMNINEIIVANFGIDKDGILQPHDGQPTLDEINQMHKLGIKMTLMVSDFELDGSEGAVKNALSNDASIKQLAAQIAEKAKAWGYDKVNLDFEKMDNYSQRDYYLFAEELSKQCKEQKLGISFSVYPKLSDNHNPKVDYNRLAELGDVIVMLYGEAYHGSTPGPPASRQFIEAGVKYIYNTVKPEYLNRFTIGFVYGATVKNILMNINGNIQMANVDFAPIDTADELAARYGVKFKWDEQKGTNYVKFNLNGREASIYKFDSDSVRVLHKIIAQEAKEKNLPTLKTAFWDTGSVFYGKNSADKFFQAQSQMAKESIADYNKQLEAIKKAEEEFAKEHGPANIGQRLQLALAERYLGGKEKVEEEINKAYDNIVIKPITNFERTVKDKVNDKISSLGF